MAQYRELAAFAQFASDLDETTRKQLQHGEIVTELMKQKQFNTMNVGEMAVSLWCINEHVYDDISVSEALDFEHEFISWVKTRYSEIIAHINQTGDLSEADQSALRQAMKKFKQSFAAKLQDQAEA